MQLPVIQSCKGCGACCLNQPVPPMLLSEAQDIPKELLDAINAYLDGPLFDDSHPCLWLNRVTGECLHYEHRPATCRDYEFAGEDCRQQRKDVGFIDTESVPYRPDRKYNPLRE